MPSRFTPELITDLQNSGLQTDNPALYDTLRRIIQINDDNATDVITATQVGDVPTIGDVAGFTATVTTQGALLNWNSQAVGNQYFQGIGFEIRNGATWASAIFVARTSTNSLLLPLQAGGSFTYSIKAYNTNGTYSTNAVTTTFTVNAPAAPVVTGTLIGHYVNLSWTTPSSSLAIDHYNVTRNGILLTTIRYNFYSYFEPNNTTNAGSDVDYTITAIDVAGNVGTESLINVINVPVIKDYTSYITKVSDFAGTRINCYRELDGSNIDTWEQHFINHGWLTIQDQIDAGFPYYLQPFPGDHVLYPGVNLTETWAEHFINNGWDTPQDQIDAGYPIYIEPMTLTAQYIEIFDMFSTYTNVNVNTTWSYLNPFNSVISVKTTLETSTDKITWSAATIGQQIKSVASVRYVRITLDFILKDVWSVWAVYWLTCSLDMANVVTDAGTLAALSTDISGTPLAFNTTFKNITSLALKPLITQTGFAAHDFTYNPNVNSCNVFVYDKNGNRISGDVNWTALGIN